MKKYELLTVLGKTMERVGMDDQLVKGLGLDYTMIMKDTMNEDIVRDEKETITFVNYWIGIAIKTLAMSSK